MTNGSPRSPARDRALDPLVEDPLVEDDSAVTVFLGATAKNIKAAQRAQNLSGIQWHRSTQSHTVTRMENVHQYQNVHDTLLLKVANTEHLHKKLQDRTRSAKAAYHATEGSLKLLQEAYKALDTKKQGLAQIFAWREEVWVGYQRDHEEYDPSEPALKEEENILLDALAQLKSQSPGTKSMKKELEKMVLSLEADLQNKDHALAIDKECMQTMHETWPVEAKHRDQGLVGFNKTHPTAWIDRGEPTPKNHLAGSLKTTPRGKHGTHHHRVHSYSGPGGGCVVKPGAGYRSTVCALPMIPSASQECPGNPSALANGTSKLPLPSTGHPKAHANNHQEIKRQQTTLRVVKNARTLEAAAKACVQTNKQLVNRTQHDCQLAAEKVERALEKRQHDLQVRIRILRKTIEDTEIAIEKLTHCKALTDDHMDSHEAPASLHEKKAILRTQRMEPENIGDPVTTAMEIHANMLKDHHVHLETCKTAEQQAIQKLEQAKKACEADLEHRLKVLEVVRRSLAHADLVVYDILEDTSRVGNPTLPETDIDPPESLKDKPEDK